MHAPTRTYTWFVAVFLALQGSSTLTALAWPAFDRAAPFLLDTTRMVAQHSTLHVATAVLAAVALATHRNRAFALGFGTFYALLAVAGWGSGRELLLELAPFDHPFHLVLGSLGLAASLLEWRTDRNGAPDVARL